MSSSLSSALEAALAAGGPRLLDAAPALDAACAGDAASQRASFRLPRTPPGARARAPGSPGVYLCGNSLGLQPVGTAGEVAAELDKWAAAGVEGHFTAPHPWVTADESVRDGSAALVGALPGEVVVMNSLTVNLHLLMVSFYAPSRARWRILVEAGAFPSDAHAVASQLVLRAAAHGHAVPGARAGGGAGADDVSCGGGLVRVAPRAGEDALRTEDVLAAIAAAGDSLALVLLPGVQYYTGQALDIPAITAGAHAVGALAGWDLAHAAGNVPLELHAWGVDFAAWCSYKYVNAGPGGIAGAFVHEKHAPLEPASEGAGGGGDSGSGGGGGDNGGGGGDAAGAPPPPRARLAGWWGHRKGDRFLMAESFVPSPGAAGWQLSNPPVLQIAALRASLAVFAAAGGVRALRARSLALTAFLEAALAAELRGRVRVITPADPAARGAQLSLVLTGTAGAAPGGARAAAHALAAEGVTVDAREPAVLRVAPAPLYNTFADVADFVRALRGVLDDMDARAQEATAAA